MNQNNNLNSRIFTFKYNNLLIHINKYNLGMNILYWKDGRTVNLEIRKCCEYFFEV